MKHQQERALGGGMRQYGAHERTGFEQLAYRVSDALSRTFCDVDVETGVENGKLVAYLSAHGDVLSKRYEDERVVVHCRIPQKHLGRIKGPNTIIRHRDSQSKDTDEPGAETMEEVA